MQPASTRPRVLSAVEGLTPSTPHPLSTPRAWTYATLMVLDGPRQLKPSQVAHDRLIFLTPPRLTGDKVEIVLTNGDAEQRRKAQVLPHESDATRIPIRLI